MSWGVYVLGGTCPGGKCPRGKCPWGMCQGSTCLGGYVLSPDRLLHALNCNRKVVVIGSGSLPKEGEGKPFPPWICPYKHGQTSMLSE